MQVNRRSFLMGTAGAAAGLAFGAGSATPAFAEDVSLRAMWWGSNDRAKRTLDVAKLYQSKTPGVTIVGESLAGDGYWTKLATQMAGGSIADVFQLEPGTISDYSKRGACLALDQFVPSTLKVDDFGADLGRGVLDNTQGGRQGFQGGLRTACQGQQPRKNAWDLVVSHGVSLCVWFWFLVPSVAAFGGRVSNTAQP